MFTQVAAPGSPLSASDFTLMIHSEIEGLATIETKNIFCCPPIPRTLSALARMVIPENILQANHDERHLIALVPEIESEIMKRRIKRYSDQVFIEKSPWAGYIIYKKSGVRILGLSNFEPGPSIKEVKPLQAFRKIAAVGSESGADGGVMEMDVYVIPKEKEYFEETVVIMLVVAQKFIELGYGIEGKPISQIIVRVSDPGEREEVSDEEEEIFAIKDCVLRRIFGLPLGKLECTNLSNRSGNVELIFGCEVRAIEEIVRKWFGIDGDPGDSALEPEEEKFCG